jgi:hypothetical protein
MLLLGNWLIGKHWNEAFGIMLSQWKRTIEETMDLLGWMVSTDTVSYAAHFVHG